MPLGGNFVIFNILTPNLLPNSHITNPFFFSFTFTTYLPSLFTTLQASITQYPSIYYLHFHPPFHPSSGKQTYQQPSQLPPSSQNYPIQMLYKIPVLPTHELSPRPSHPLVHPSPETPLSKYTHFLQACYAEHGFASLKWPHLDARKYINLAVINNEYVNRKELIEFREQTIQGSIDDILEWKAPIDMKDILKPNCIQEYDSNTQKKCD